MRGLALLSLTITLLPACGGSESSPVVVPAVVGLKQSLAAQAAKEVGLKMQIEHGRDKVCRGWVYSQTPRDGSIAKKGDTLTFRVSTGSPNACLRDGTIVLTGKGASLIAYQQSVLGIRSGSTAAEVRSVLGAPYTKELQTDLSGHPETCWIYHASYPGTPISWVGVCLRNGQRVELIVVG